MTARRRDYIIPVEEDGLITCGAGPWTIEKYRRMGYYADLFATGMKNSWDQRVYVDLYAGPGYSFIRSEGLVMASPLIALSIRDQFDRYILCDRNEDYLAALCARFQRHGPKANVRYVPGDVNEVVGDVIAEIPTGPRVLTFCFVDPYNIEIAFETVRQLACDRNIDFMILHALGMDANRNTDLHPERTDRFLGDQDWRSRWGEAKAENTPGIYFLASEYSRRMEALKYIAMRPEDMCSVRSDRNSPLYYLALFSRSRKAVDFWKTVQRYAPEQPELRFPGL